MAKDKNTTEMDNADVIAEAGQSEGSLSPSGGTGGGDIKTKTIADIVSKLGSLGPDDLNGFKASIDQIGKEADVLPGGAEGANRKSVETKPSHASTKGLVREDLDKIFKSEEGGDVLSEAFIDQATTLFESAVTLRVADEVEQAEIALREESDAALAELTESYNTRMDTYLDYVAEQFVEKNRVEIETSIRAELNEAFIGDLRQVFENHNLEMPESDIDVVGQLKEEIDELKSQLNEAVTTSLELSAEIESGQKADVLADVMEGLSDTQKDKMVTLAEDIDFENDDQFRTKMSSLKESFFSESKATNDSGLILEADGVVVEEQKAQPTGTMGAYASAISRHAKK